MARKAPLEVPLYYRIALNNFKPTLILSFLLRIADLFHLSDPYPFFVFLSVFWVLVTVICTCFLIKGTNRWKYRIVLLLLFILTLPVSVHTGSLYTDSMTFGTASVCIFLLNTGYQTHCAGVPSTAKINSVIPLSAIAGILCSVGFAIKVTVIIPFIAASVVFLLYSMQHSGNRKMKWADLLVRILLPFFFCFGLTSLLLEVWAGQYEDYTLSKNTCEPVISYIALGLTEDGSFAKNSDFNTRNRK